ncbi:hypothetical protein [Lysinibacillus sphaericus]|uniref:hypothetical protein n=1 Tax=Lysinibacillus sphaericus TaxID=1421 RepID=UPI00248D27B1|nr:hypothetical protein [Lysinibacillus sphaericus]
MQRLYGEWQVSSNENTGGITYTCGFCNNSVCPPRKYVCLDNEYPRNATAFVFVCTSCNRPSFISINTIEQVPGKQYGSEIQFLPDDIAGIYKEAKDSHSVRAYTASSLLCRKILMNVSVSKGAEEGETFQFYVDF